MKRHQALSFAVALALSAAAVNATPPSFAADRARWIPVEARNHATGASGPAAVLFGVAHERGRGRPASLRVECFDGVTAVHMDADGLRLGPWAVDGAAEPRRRSLRRRLLAAQRRRDRPRAVGRARRGVRERAVRQEPSCVLPSCGRLSVPFLFTFTVAGAEPGLQPAGRPVPLVGRAGDQRRRPLDLRLLSFMLLSPARGRGWVRGFAAQPLDSPLDLRLSP